MHGAWAFDLILFLFTAAGAGLALRQITLEHEENDRFVTPGRRSPSR